MKPKNQISVKKIAEVTGVSPSTVSLVLNGKCEKFRISEKTARRVIDAADKLGYNHVKREKRMKNLNKTLISAFCPLNFNKGPAAKFFLYATNYLKRQNLQYELVLFPFEMGRLKEKAKWISSRFAAGAILMALSGEDVEFIENSSFDIPLVLYNRVARGYCSVLNDDYAVGDKAMSHFIKRGHKTFGIISPDYSSRALSLRTVGYFNKFKSSKLNADGCFAEPVAVSEDNDGGGFKAMDEILRSGKAPSAIFVLSDNMVSGVVRCIYENGFSIPDDFEIISYGNNTVNSIVVPHVTSFEPPLEQMSINCVKTIQNSIESGSMQNNVRLSFEAELHFRESSPET